MFSRIFTYSIKNIFRNKFLSFSSVLVIMLLMFFINILLVIQNISFKIIDTANDRGTIDLYLKKQYDDNSIEVVTLINNLKKLNGTINVNYTSKADALELMRVRYPDLVGIAERQNPLPNTIRISNVGMKEYGKLDYLIKGSLYLFKEEIASQVGSDGEIAKIAKFSTYAGQIKQITGVVDYLVVLRVSLYIIIGMFLLSIAIIIYSIIGNFIYHYKDEIYITRLVGGSKIFIYGPFGIQGILYALLGSIFGIGLFYASLETTNLLLKKNYELGYVLGEHQLIFLVEILVLMLIGGLSGLISSRKYLNSN